MALEIVNNRHELLNEPPRSFSLINLVSNSIEHTLVTGHWTVIGGALKNYHEFPKIPQAGLNRNASCESRRIAHSALLTKQQGDDNSRYKHKIHSIDISTTKLEPYFIGIVTPKLSIDS